ncbi:MAG: hypothetical protein Q9161_004543 [Pseudevernia consocians]
MRVAVKEMDGPGPEPKRQRLDYHKPHSHGHATTLPPPPHTYQPPQQPPPPPSPYDVGPHDNRNLPDPGGPNPHAYVQEHSGTSTPRDQRFPPDPGYSRRSSASVVPRSPDGHHQYPPGRSLSTAEGPHYPSQYPGEPSGYPSHEPPPNGNIHQGGLPMHPYEQAHGYPPPHHIEYSQSPVTAGPPYGGANYIGHFGQAGARPLKKGNRATQACDVCRTRKAKCDEGRPECGFCVENNMRCNYQSVAPAKADRANQQIIDQLSSHKEEMKALKEDWGGRFDKLEQMILDMGGGRSLTIERPDTKPPQLKLESPPGPATGQLPGGVDNLSSEPTARDTGIVDTSPGGSLTDSTGSDPVAARTNEIYIAHNTAAQKLFRWRSINQLLRQSSSKLDLPDRAEGYVMDYEINKGVLRIYGKGRQLRNAGFASPMSAAAASPTPSNVSVAGDESSTASSPASSPSESLWGTGFMPGAEIRPTSDVGGLSPDNTLKLEARTISRLLQSYLDNIHILHPFLDQRELGRMIEHFKRRHNPHDTNSSKVGFAVPVNANLDAVRDSHAILNRAQKRKHSDGQFYGALGESSLAPSPMSPKILLEKSPETALTLLVMALGKICECRAPLPEPVRDNVRETSNHYSPSRGHTDSPPPPYPQPMRHSPSASSHSTASTSAPSPLSAGRLAGSSPRSSVGELPSGLRNVDVIPGLAYYAQATDILGNLTGLHDLTYAQCCLLAGLYAGQLANTLESLTWIQMASRICRLLVSEESFTKMREAKKEVIKIAFWSSLQLESDILAELDVPPSGIQSVLTPPEYPKSMADHPIAVYDDPGKAKVMTYYCFQLMMRKSLNDIQTELYKAPNFERVTRSASLINAFNTNIWEWRKMLPQDLQWEDTEPPARYINDARLRGKFYGAQYIIHRPFLHAALDFDFSTSDVQSPNHESGDGPQNNTLHQPVLSPDAQAGTMGPPKPVSDPGHHRRAETINFAVKCIRAAEESTVAFDGILDHRRLVVTNIMGTAHAQFGNMLVLSAAYKSKTLGQYVERGKLSHLFDRTIKMLGDLAPISQTLAKDCSILQCLRKVVFEGGDNLATSFSSE